MPRKSKNKFDVDGDEVSISQENWDFRATASIRDDYAEEIQSVTWSKKGAYLYSNRLNTYLHIYIMEKWYGKETCEQMKSDGYVVDHMDNDGHNCCIDNLCFLAGNENTAKGLTLDKYKSEKEYIALSLFKDFSTDLIQMTISFNYPAAAKMRSIDGLAIIDFAHLLYECEYEMVLIDAKAILHEYKRDFAFDPEKLHCADFHIEGKYGKQPSKEAYDRYIGGDHEHTVFFISKTAPLYGWRVEDNRHLFSLRGNPSQQE